MRKLVIFPVKLLLTPDGKRFDAAFCKKIRELSKDHWFAAVSDDEAPLWFKKHVQGVEYIHAKAFGGPRRSGKFVDAVIAASKGSRNLVKSQIVILGYRSKDVGMYVNSKSIFVRCDWRQDVEPNVKKYGIPCRAIEDLEGTLRLLQEEEPWFFRADAGVYDLYCLTNAATRAGSDEELKKLAATLQDCLKRGSEVKRREFTAALMSSLYATDAFKAVDYWTFYPSSSSKNSYDELIYDFYDLARTSFSRTKEGENPIIIRHSKTLPRHSSLGADRENPSSQIETIHLHPDYKSSLNGKTVAILDDYTTTGVSFSVAAAFLKAAGASKVLAIALGKFPRDGYVWDIHLKTSPFAPVKDYQVKGRKALTGVVAPQSSAAFKRKLT